MAALTFRSFSGGEIDPEYHADIQNTQRQSGLKKARNFVIKKSGAAENRAGFGYIADVTSASFNVRIIEFILNEDTTYILALGHNTLNVYGDGVLKDTVATPWNHSYLFDLQGVQSGNVITVTSVSGTSNQNPVYEITRVSDTDWTVTQKTFGPSISPPPSVGTTSITSGSNTYEYTVTAIDKYGSESYAGTNAGAAFYGISIPQSSYGTDYSVRFTSSSVHGLAAGDRVYIDGSTTAPEVNGHYFTVESVPSTTVAVLASIDGDDFDIQSGVKYVQATTQANPVEVTITGGHSFTNGQTVYMFGCEMVELNERVFTVANATATTFELSGENGTGHTAGSTGFCHLADNATAKFYTEGKTQGSAAAPTTADPHGVTWIAPTTGEAVEYNIYRKDDGGTWGYIGTSTELLFYDTGITPDVTIRPPIDNLTFFNAADWPAVVGRYQQSLWLGNTENNVELIKRSKVGDDTMFSPNTPIEAGDAFEFSLSGARVNEIRHILDVNGLVVMTSGGEWLIAGDQNGSITPQAPNPKQGSYNGSSKVAPLVINKNAIYVQNKNGAIRDLRYEFESNGYTGTDLIEFAAHLFKGTTVKDWCYQQTPNSNIWVCNEDGTAAVLTYIPERGMVAWAPVDTAGGTIESLACVPEDGVDRVYAIIKRTVDGSTVRYLERMADRNVTDLETDCIFMDSNVTIDGRNTGTRTMTIAEIGGNGYDALTEVTVTASTSYFVAGDVGNYMHIRTTSSAFNQETGETDTTVTETIVQITGYTSGTVVTGLPQADVPAAHQAVATTNWGKAINTVTGADHLEGETVVAMADGDFVSADTMVVASGEFDLDASRYAEVIHYGLLYYSDVETLDIDIPSGESLLDRNKRVNRVHLLVNESKDCHVGQDFNNLVKTTFTISDGKELDNGQLYLRIPSRYDKKGHIVVRMKECKPITLTGLVLVGSIEGGE